jgi:hypothetical protein
MMQIGTGEVFILIGMAIIYALPIAAAIWVLATLRRIRSDMEAFRGKLEAIEGLLQNNNASFPKG